MWSLFLRIRTEYEKMRTRITLNMDTFYAVLDWNITSDEKMANLLQNKMNFSKN